MLWLFAMLLAWPRPAVVEAANDGLHIPLALHENPIQHLVIPGTIDIMAPNQPGNQQDEGGEKRQKLRERRTVQVHIFLMAASMPSCTILKGIFFVGEPSNPIKVPRPSDAQPSSLPDSFNRYRYLPFSDLCPL
jgi:hypothetical protein